MTSPSETQQSAEKAATQQWRVEWWNLYQRDWREAARQWRGFTGFEAWCWRLFGVKPLKPGELEENDDWDFR